MKINEMGENSGRYLKEDGTIINMADIQGATLRDGSLIGKVTITTTATALRAGTADLTSRHTLTLLNDSSVIVYIGFDSAVTTVTGFIINSGTGKTFKLDPNSPFTLYGVTSELETILTIMELK